MARAEDKKSGQVGGDLSADSPINSINYLERTVPLGPEQESKIPIIEAVEGLGPVNLWAKSALLLDAQTGKIIYQKNARVRRSPASTTKMMTVLVALELGDLDDKVTVSERVPQTQGASLRLKAGEVISLRDLLYGALLKSANDACVALAEHIAGSEENFVWVMNEKAKAIGALETHFVNCHGLDSPEHYSTAYDLALIGRKAMENPTFQELVKTPRVQIKSTLGKKEKVRYLISKNRLLNTFEGTDGVKTGFTRDAGYCLVASASRMGYRMIAVVLVDKNRWQDSKNLLAAGFDYLQKYIRH
jgi:D-alanyl-D-alanine carboxypeptidase (penicillin-binding protein 5/6)